MAVHMLPLTDADRELIAAAEELLNQRFVSGQHEVTAAIRTQSGAIYTGINIVTDVDTAGIHAEPIAIGQAIIDGEAGLETSVAVTYVNRDPSNEMGVISACGVCRELLKQYGPEMSVIVPGNSGPTKWPIEDLLPAKTPP